MTHDQIHRHAGGRTGGARSTTWKLALLGACAALACSRTPYPEVPVEMGSSAPVVKTRTAAHPSPALRFSVASMQSPRDTFEAYSRVFQLLGRKLGGADVEFIQRRTYAEVNEMLAAGKLDAALICTGGYLDLERNAPGAIEVLAVPVIDGRTTYSSLVIVPAQSKAHGIGDLKGKRFAFTDELSMSGHVYVAHLLGEQGATEGSFFSSFTFTRSHDRSIEAVARGLFDGAAVDSLVFDQLVRANPALASTVRVIHRSPAFGVAPIVASAHVTPERRKEIRKALLSLHTDPEGADALRSAGIERFIEPPAGLYVDARSLITSAATR